MMNKELAQRKRCLSEKQTAAWKEYESSGINLNINRRWEEGACHHPKSTELMAHISTLDWMVGNDRFCFKTGGDGDNGEHLMFILDIYFDHLEKP
jgi:hypothetical protein